jgi:hypothetical protein
MPVKDQKIGRDNAVVLTNVLLDLDEVIDALRYWSERSGFQLFTVKSYVEKITSRGVRSIVKIHFKKDIDFYLRQEFDIELNVKRGKRGQFTTADGEVKTLILGDLSAGINTKLIPDYDDSFTKRGNFWKVIHNLFYELIYKPRFIKYKIQTGIATGKTMTVIKDKVKTYEKFRPTS